MAMQLEHRGNAATENLEPGEPIMNTLAAHGTRELDAVELDDTRGGNPGAAVALGGAFASVFGWGVRYGYTVVGPWLFGER
jgi:hypothetical protein